MLKLETLLCGDIDFPSTNEVKVLIIVSHLNGSGHNLLYSGECSSGHVCAYICEDVSVSVSITFGAPNRTIGGTSRWR